MKRDLAHFARSLTALVCGVCLGCYEVTPPPQGDPHQRALIVAISQYDHWDSVNAHNDVPLILAALEAQGFGAVEVLRDGEATREGIEEAIRRQLLDPARPGDVLVFYYSGHGQRVPDDGSDEIDGYDEALVPYDAPASAPAGYQGERHLRDDVVHGRLRELRDKVGPEGHVIAILDTCFSGSFRGVHSVVRGGVVDEILVRGGPPLGDPAQGAAGGEPGGGFYEAPTAPRGTLFRDPSPRAPYVVFSAARHDQLAWETTGDDGRSVGSLTYALTRALNELDEGATYRLLLERIRCIMAKRVTNEPQVEGDVDTVVFDGRFVPQPPYLPVVEVASGGSEVILPAGFLMGLLKGSRVEMHREGTRQPSGNTRLARGDVEESAPARASVRLEGSAGEAELWRSRAFVTHYSYGSLRIRARLAGLEPDLESRLEELIAERVSAVEIVDGEAEVVVFPGEAEGSEEPRLAVETVQDRVSLLSPIPISTPNLVARVAARLQDYARNRYLRGIRITDNDFDVDLEMLPVTVGDCRDLSRPSPDTCEVAVLSPETTPERWTVGDWFELRIHNRSDYSAFIAILDLMSDGRIGMLWPPLETGDKSQIAGNDVKTLDALYRITPPAGVEVILMIASRGYIDFSPFVSRGRLTSPLPRASVMENLGPFGQLFDDLEIRARTAAYFPSDRLRTEALTLYVAQGGAPGRIPR